MKKVLIPFSGGLDSTYLVWKNLKEGNRVTVVYFEIENNKNKVKLEKIHRDKIFKELKKEFPNTLFEEYFEYKIGAGGIKNNYSLIQVPIWMLGVFMASSPEYDEIQMGYVMNDCAISYLKEISDLYKALQLFSNDKKYPELTFPIIKEHKTEILRTLPENLLKYVYSCENPDILNDDENEIVYRNCCHCVPCNSYKDKTDHHTEYVFNDKIIRVFNKKTSELNYFYPNDLVNGEKGKTLYSIELSNIHDFYLKDNSNHLTSKEDSGTINIKRETLGKIINQKELDPDEIEMVNYFKNQEKTELSLDIEEDAEIREELD